METGKIVKQLRLRKGLTQEELAEKTDISVRTIQRIESGEVDPRAYTLQAIAAALDVEYSLFDKTDSPDLPAQESRWLPLIHLSGLLVLIVPPIILWIWKRNKVQKLDEHAKDVINYQLSLQVYALPCVLFSIWPIFIVLAIYSQSVIILNTVRVNRDLPYRYRFSIPFIR